MVTMSGKLICLVDVIIISSLADTKYVSVVLANLLKFDLFSSGHFELARIKINLSLEKVLKFSPKFFSCFF